MFCLSKFLLPTLTSLVARPGRTESVAARRLGKLGHRRRADLDTPPAGDRARDALPADVLWRGGGRRRL